MGKLKAKKVRNNKRNNKRRKLGLKPKKKQNHPAAAHDHDLVLFGGEGGVASGGRGGGGGSDDESSGLPTPDRLHRLLEPYTKDQLIGFLLDAAAADPDVLARIHAVADRDVSHRKIFVHGLGWDATRETLLQAFEPYGPIEDCNVVVDKVTGRAKGYGFVLFGSRAGAVRALKQPQKKIKNRVASCQLASIGPVPAAGGAADTAGRKIHVSNVHADAAPDRLKAFFARFGEIEAGPIGFDMLTGKSRGFALFVYKTQEGARRALEEPYKMFEGHQLHCQLATDSQKGKAPALAPSSALLGPASQPVLAAVAAAQNLALLGQNPAYSALLGQNPLLAAAALNPAAAAALNPAVATALNPAAATALNQGAAAALNTAAAGLVASQGQTLGGGVGVGGGAPSLLGAYGSQVTAGLQGLQSYEGTQLGQSSSLRPGGSFGGFPSYV
uniref:UBP1-associated protein 2B isoform X1 n=1 Tax=Elaeis guineensis var. tenera TaxID=51953 RepID=A0A6I9RGB9_ELAGV|nr:UBP1-associated protein 2B isoform X1 [Elaeis guineensis]